MLDRTLAPAFKEIDSINVIRANSSFLKNGIPFHLIQCGNEEVIRLELIFDAGHWFEPANGISFFTTKLLTAGTKHYSALQIEEKIAIHGAFIEIIPGNDRATIVLYCLSKHLKDILPLLVEVVNNPAFPENELENLKNITLQNLKVNLKKTSYQASSQFRKHLFGADHPYSRTIDEKAILETDRDKITLFHRQRFNCANLNIVISGNGREDFFDLLNQSFGNLSVGKKESTFDSIEETTVNQKNVLIDMEESIQSSIRMGINLFPISHPDYFNLNFLIEVFGGYFGSRLMKNIREEKGYTYGINASFNALKNTGYLVIGTDVNKENTQNTIDEIKKEIRILQNTPIPQDEVSTVKNYLLGAFVSSLSTPFGLADKFKTIYFNNLDYEFYDKYFNSLQNINTDEVMSLAKKYLNEDTLLEVIAGGK